MKYYRHVRAEILPLISGLPFHRVLEIGCASGSTLRWIKTIRPGVNTVGLDKFAAALQHIKQNADEVFIQDLNDPLPDIGSFDLILALDVLEHLVDPAAVLEDLRRRLNPGGSVIVSLPNMAHYSVSLPLLLRRKFEYRDEGITDRTHLRWFVEETALKLLRDAGFQVTAGLLGGFHGRSRLMNKLSFGVARHWLAEQYIMRGELADDRRVSSVRWNVAEPVLS